MPRPMSNSIIIFEVQIGYSHIVNEEYEGFNAKSMDVFEMFVGYNPSESIRLGVFSSMGESIRYDD